MDTRDMLADGLTKGGTDRTLLHRISNGCRFQAIHGCAVHTKVKEEAPLPSPDTESGSRA